MHAYAWRRPLLGLIQVAPLHGIAVAGTLPPGLVFNPATGALTGRASTPGTYGFAVAAADSEGRTASYTGSIVVAKRLEVLTRRLARGKVRRAYRSKLTSAGGVAPVAWRVKRGPLPKGIRFNKATGTFIGVPARAGTWVVAVEARDALGVKAPADVVIVIAPSLAKKKR